MNYLKKSIIDEICFIFLIAADVLMTELALFYNRSAEKCVPLSAEYTSALISYLFCMKKNIKKANFISFSTISTNF